MAIAIIPLIVLALALLTNCQGQVVGHFPQHDEPLRTDRGNEYFFGELIARDGCLRLDYSTGYFEGLTLLLVWPPGFSVSVEDGPVRVIDTAGSMVAKLGDDVRFSGRSIGDSVWPVYADEPGPDQPQARLRWREQLKEWQQVEQEWQQRLSVDCPGPFLMVGDEVTVVGPDEPTVISIPGSTLLFPRRKSIKGPRESHTLGVYGKVVLAGDCLRLGDHEGPLFEWPAGFTPYIEGGEVEIRNGAGRTIVRVGDSITSGGQAGRYEDNPYAATCPEGLLHIESKIKVLPDVEVYFPKQDGSLAIDQEMESFVGRLVLDRKCLNVDSVRDRERVVFPVPPLLIWPDTFTLSTEDEVVGIVDAAGRTVARVGDDVQFSAAAVSYGQAMERSGLREISPACSGPLWVVADDFTAVPDSDSP